MNTPYTTPESSPQSLQITSGKKRLKSVSVLQAGIVAGVSASLLCLVGALLFIPFLLIGAFSAAPESLGAGGVGIIGVLVFIPIIYGVIGFLGGVIYAFIYNIIAKLTGGLEFTLEDV